MRRRIMMLAAGTALLAVALLAVPLGVLAAHGYLRDERLELQQAAATAAAQARGDVTVTAPPHVETSEIQLTVYDRAGHRISGPGSATAAPLVRAALTGRQATATTDVAIAVAAPVSDGDQVVAVLLLATNLDAVHQRTARAWLALAGMCLAAVVVSTLGARLLARRLTRPVDRLNAIASRVGAGDLNARAAPSGVGEIDTLARTLNDTVERIEVMIRRERAFSAEVSHQLRTPLSGLRLELEAARAALPTPSDRGDAPSGPAAQHIAADEAASGLARALVAVDRLEATMTDVISLARDLPAAQRVDAPELLRAAAGRWHGLLAASSRPLRVINDVEPPQHLGISSTAATQILDILLDNAYKHGRGAITLRTRTAGDGLAALDVSDEGPPLGTKTWQLFRRRGDTAEHGIGLPYARRLAEAEGARLTLAATDPPTFTLITTVGNSARTSGVV